jgi:oligopeptide transport system ATP-binding protein
MYAGQISERGTADDIFYNPKHEYTKGLLKSIPTVQDVKQRLKPIGGNPVDLLNMPDGCPFAPRCDNAMKICLSVNPVEMTIEGKHTSRCWMNVREGIENGTLTKKQAEEMYHGK